MIYLTKGQPLSDNPNLVVYDPTGYYNDGDSVICAPVGTPEEPVCRYEAKYILYGGMVYSVSNPDDLMTEILKIDPASLFGKDSQQIAVDKMVDKIVPQESGQVTEEATTEEVDPTSDLPTEEATSTNPKIEPIDDQIIDLTSTTSPSTTIEPVLPDNISTTSTSNTINSSSTPNPVMESLDTSPISTTTETVSGL